MDNNTITITIDDLDESGMTIISSPTMAEPTIDISSITTSTVDTSAFDDLFSSNTDFELTLNDPVEFEDFMPEVAKIEDMCNDYPALAQAYDKFKTMYALVHQDWKGRQEDNEPPF